jgi:HPt (histidine-containing phosphotransfer) domain-containing protein
MSSDKSRLGISVTNFAEHAEQTLACAENLLDLYLQSASVDLAELDRALARGDILRVASMAHRLKQTASGAGASGAAEAAAQIEAGYRKGAFEALPFQVEAYRRAQVAFEEETTAAQNRRRCEPCAG